MIHKNPQQPNPINSLALGAGEKHRLALVSRPQLQRRVRHFVVAALGTLAGNDRTLGLVVVAAASLPPLALARPVGLFVLVRVEVNRVLDLHGAEHWRKKFKYGLGQFYVSMLGVSSPASL